MASLNTASLLLQRVHPACSPQLTELLLATKESHWLGQKKDMTVGASESLQPCCLCQAAGKASCWLLLVPAGEEETRMLKWHPHMVPTALGGSAPPIPSSGT